MFTISSSASTMKPSNCLLFAQLASSLILPRVQPAVSVANVTFNGRATEGVETFFNIRFGQDTGGENRFASPKPFTYDRDAVVDASRPGAACPQAKVPLPGFSVFDNVTNVSEDCLNLRVERPAQVSGKLPVMVYIYGGGDTIGQIYDSAYDPSMLVSSSAAKGMPIIYVAMNYRLGIFGFAATPAMEASALNAGLQDQRLALLWVQKHIAAFGGDPDNVTIFGESDGATGVGLQITAYGGQKNTPFQRAIMQSGGPTADSGTAGNISAVHTAAVIKLASCTSPTNAEELACLRKKPLSTLLPIMVKYELNLTPFGGFDVFIPTSPSEFIPESPSRLLKTGKFAHGIDLMTGWNENDRSLFTPTSISSDSDVSDILVATLPGLSQTSVDEALALYPVSSFANSDNVSAQYFRASRMGRDNGFACPSLLMVQSNANHSATATTNFIFTLNQTLFAPLYAEQNTSYYGVSHFSDIPYVFNQATTRYKDVASPSDIQLSSRMSGSWASFATYGDPSRGKGTLSGWKSAVTAADNGSAYNYDLRIIGGPDAGTTEIGGVGTSYEELARRCAFWNSDTLLEQQQI